MFSGIAQISPCIYSWDLRTECTTLKVLNLQMQTGKMATNIQTTYNNNRFLLISSNGNVIA